MPIIDIIVCENQGIKLDDHTHDGGNESARQGPHGEYHFHLNGDPNKVVNAYTLQPENLDALSKKEKKILNELSPKERTYIKKACRKVFHNNHIKGLPKLRFRYLTVAGSIFGPFMSNTVTEVCDKDTNNDLPEVCQ